MSRQAVNYRVFGQLAVYLVTIAIILLAADYSLQLTLDNLRTISLLAYAKGGLERISSDLALLEAEVDAVSQRVEALKRQTYPNLADIKMLSREFNLRLERMERITVPPGKLTGPNRYNTTFHGTVGSLIRFVRKLETEYIFSREQVVLYPVDEEGKVIGLAMTISIAEDEQ